MRFSSRADLSEWTARVAHVWGAPPGVYQHTSHGGLAIYMAMSRKVGSIDVGAGALQMKAQAGDFIVGAPGSAAQMHSFRGGHWIEVVLTDRVFASGLGEVGWEQRDIHWQHRSFHRNREVRDLLARFVRRALSVRPPDTPCFDTLAHLSVVR